MQSAKQASLTDMQAGNASDQGPVSSEDTGLVEQVNAELTQNEQIPPSQPLPINAEKNKSAIESLSAYIQPLLWGLLGLLSIIAFGLFWVFWKRKKKHESFESDESVDLDSSMPLQPASLEDKRDLYDNLFAAVDLELSSKQYIKAKDLLEESITIDPVNAYLKLKLMEVALESGDQDLFQYQAGLLSGNKDPDILQRIIVLKSKGPKASSSTPAFASIDLDEPEYKKNSFDFDGGSTVKSQSIDVHIGEDIDLEGLGLYNNFDIKVDDTPDDITKHVVDQFDSLSLDNISSLDNKNDLKTQLSWNENQEPVVDIEVDKAPISPQALAQDDDFEFDLSGLENELNLEMPSDKASVKTDLNYSSSDNDLDELEALLADTGNVSVSDKKVVMAEPSEQEQLDLLDSLESLLEQDASEVHAQVLEQPIKQEPVKEESDMDYGFDEAPSEEAVSIKFDLVNTYQELGDDAGARDLLEEILLEGSEQDKAKALAMLQTLGLS